MEKKEKIVETAEKQGPGRPALAESVAKIQVNVPADLNHRLRNKAAAAGLSLPEFLRSILHGAAK